MHVKQLTSGRYQAIVKLRNGRQISFTHPSKRAVEDWARERELERSRGIIADPRGARVPLGEVAEAWLDSRVVEPRTIRDYRGTWRNHLEPDWADVPLGSINRLEVESWLRRKLDAGMSARNGQKCLDFLRAVLSSAIDQRLIAANPVKGIKPPRTAKKPPAFWTREEAATLLDAFGADHRTMVNLMLHTGLRWGEAAGLRWGDVDLHRGQVTVNGVITQEGKYRAYPKSKRSHRVVPLTPELERKLRGGEGWNDYVFPAPGGGAWRYENWLRRVWQPALAKTELTGTPHKTRHTYASWLVQAGVSIYKVQQLLGHESVETTMIYAHLAPDHFDQVLAALG